MLKLNRILNQTFNLTLKQTRSFAAASAHHEIDHKKIILRDEKSGTNYWNWGYYINPFETSRRIMRIIALHDAVKNP